MCYVNLNDKECNKINKVRSKKSCFLCYLLKVIKTKNNIVIHNEYYTK